MFSKEFDTFIFFRIKVLGFPKISNTKVKILKTQTGI